MSFLGTEVFEINTVLDLFFFFKLPKETNLLNCEAKVIPVVKVVPTFISSFKLTACWIMYLLIMDNRLNYVSYSNIRKISYMFLLLETLVLSDVTKALPSPAPLPLLLFSSFVQENTRDTDWVPSVSLRHMRLIYTNPLPSCLPWECCVWICGWCCHLLVLSPSSICIIKWSQKTDISLCLFFFCCCCFQNSFIATQIRKRLVALGLWLFLEPPWHAQSVFTRRTMHTRRLAHAPWHLHHR